MTKSLRKSLVFTFRLTREQRARLSKIATKVGKTPGALVRDLVLQEMGRMESSKEAA